MNDMILATTVRTQLALKSLAGKLHQDRGASALEYVGMLLVGAIFITAISEQINKGSVGQWVKRAVDSLNNIK
ncbi:MAG: hypothetical protein R5N60_08485 [Cutibacterium granulosum]|uniref:hypothetical protein n=1 Tax=Cutibacterium granulosum TaxID=33011 RepID=UPI002B2283AF|nr:hypothetical protein [Cutibacterium granulosum]MEA5635232.1 hypothetical protein [Cutibacterium granulosum]MEA5638435.1 hypothetical protein [Cutibacterium granulosum]MEA5647452.1 hypothetical protein [Cutibacterium granulosum]MEA5656835.1 hypothetical protein [Cutibacterium granulosum]